MSKISHKVDLISILMLLLLVGYCVIAVWIDQNYLWAELLFYFLVTGFSFMCVINALIRRNLLSVILLCIACFLWLGSGSADRFFTSEELTVFCIVFGIVLTGLCIAYFIFTLLTTWWRRLVTERIIIGQVAAVVRQNLPLSAGLAMAAQFERGWARIHLRRISKLLAQGSSLSEAVRQGFPDCSRLSWSLIQAGERTGQLASALDQAEQLLIEHAHVREQRHTSVWPYFVLLMTGLTFIVTLSMVAIVPKFKEIFKDFEAEIPRTTLMLMGISEWFVSGSMEVPVPGWVYVLCSSIFIILIRRYSRLTDWVRWHIPGLRWIELNRGMALILRTVRMAVRAGMNLEPAARLAVDVDINQRLRPRIIQFADLLNRGTNPREAARSTGLGEVAATALASGQRTGDMDAALSYAIDYYNAMLSRWWIMLRNLVWPVATLLAGLVVGVVVYALFEPLVVLIEVNCDAW